MNLLSETKAAEFLGITKRCLQNWRHIGGGPEYVRISSRCVRYEPEALHAFIAARRVNSTSEAA